MSFVNAVLRGIFDLLLAPFQVLPLVGMVIISLVAAVGMLLVFKATSNQAALEQVKRKIHACLFEIRLFNDDVPAIFRAQGEILRHNLTYLRLSLVPMVWIILPLFFVVAQLQFHYGYRGLQPGETAVVTVELDQPPADGSRPSVAIEAPPGLRVETPGIWVPSRNEVSWRLGAREEGEYELGVTLDGQTQGKSVVVSNRVARISPIRLQGTLVNQLIYPAEAGLPKGGPIRSISVSYQEADFSLFGWKTHWIIAFFILSIVFAFALRKPMGVQI